MITTALLVLFGYVRKLFPFKSLIEKIFANIYKCFDLYIVPLATFINTVSAYFHNYYNDIKKLCTRCFTVLLNSCWEINQRECELDL